jgi:hypothetical protein
MWVAATRCESMADFPVDLNENEKSFVRILERFIGKRPDGLLVQN